MSELGANLKDLETIVQRKQANARTIEEGKMKKNKSLNGRYEKANYLNSVKAENYGEPRAGTTGTAS